MSKVKKGISLTLSKEFKSLKSNIIQFPGPNEHLFPEGKIKCLKKSDGKNSLSINDPFSGERLKEIITTTPGLKRPAGIRVFSALSRSKTPIDRLKSIWISNQRAQALAVCKDCFKFENS